MTKFKVPSLVNTQTHVNIMQIIHSTVLHCMNEHGAIIVIIIVTIPRFGCLSCEAKLNNLARRELKLGLLTFDPVNWAQKRRSHAKLALTPGRPLEEGRPGID